jgi:nucleotide-binding universal stress UspA family protein
MATIVLATDFSAPSENAALFAAALARDLNVSILLVHVYQLPMTLDETPPLLMSTEEIRNSADRSLVRTKEAMEKSYPGINVRSESRMGDIEEEIRAVSREVSPIMIIVGSQHTEGIERLFIENSALSIIRKSKVPVLAIPLEAKVSSLRNMALATDLKGMKHFPFTRITEIQKALQCTLFAVHVHSGDEQHTDERQQIRSALGVDCDIVQADHYTEGLNRYISEKSIDVLAVIPHRHSFFERLFTKTHTPDLVENLSIPVLCIPED